MGISHSIYLHTHYFNKYNARSSLVAVKMFSSLSCGCLCENKSKQTRKQATPFQVDCNGIYYSSSVLHFKLDSLILGRCYGLRQSEAFRRAANRQKLVFQKLRIIKRSMFSCFYNYSCYSNI